MLFTLRTYSMLFTLRTYSMLFTLRTYSILFTLRTYSMLFTLRTYSMLFTLRTYSMLFTLRSYSTLLILRECSHSSAHSCNRLFGRSHQGHSWQPRLHNGGRHGARPLGLESGFLNLRSLRVEVKTSPDFLLKVITIIV